MNKGVLPLVVATLLLVPVGQLLARPRSAERLPPSAHRTMPSPAQGTTASGQVIPDKGELPPGPDLTPEERERLLQGTMRAVSEAPRSDEDCSSPHAR